MDCFGPGVVDGYKLLHGCWELGLGPLQQQTVLLTAEHRSKAHFGF